jgi:hypothetical protein
MRIWDIDPGFLNTASLLGEHRELHGIYSIIVNKKRGYARHPETMRWASCIGGLSIRHNILVAEMQLRGFNHHSPLIPGHREHTWPAVFMDEPGKQYALLQGKYQHKKPGRIPLPATIHALWAAHKYSVMARDYTRYQAIGPLVAGKRISFAVLSRELSLVLRSAPSRGSLANTLSHMWGYVSHYADTPRTDDSPAALLKNIQELTHRYQVSYLLQSTALGELGCWIDMLTEDATITTSRSSSEDSPPSSGCVPAS